MAVRIEIQELSSAHHADAADLAARAMADNPNHVAAFGSDAEGRVTSLRRMFTVVLGQQLSRGIVLGAFRSGKLVGVLGMMPPGRCPSVLAGKMTALSTLLLGSGLKNSRHVLEWMEDWKESDAEVTHWHLGPMGVEPRWQGHGIGIALLQESCQRIDEDCCAAYLENDRVENVPLFERFGFEVADEHEVLGHRNWFMLRDADRGAGA
ncbi:MAG: GNAT family N-acetyltransferase [Gammaproteobacteria bacterium]